MNKSSPYTSSYRSEIDGLRAFAVLSVVAFHAFPSWLKGGFIGVDVFFVISGFLITSHIFESLDKGQFSFTDFFGRRIRRIFPALILVMGCSLAFGWFALLADEFAQLGKHVASGAAFITNFILVNESGYFDNVAETRPMLHLWSLAVEEQFYIVWPLVLWLAWKRKFNLLTITILVAVVSFYLNLRFVTSHPTETFFWPVGRFWELLSGSVLAWLLLYKSDVLSRFKQWTDKLLVRFSPAKGIHTDSGLSLNLISLIGLFLLSYGVLRINEGLPFPSAWSLIPVLGTVLVIASGSKAWLNRIFLMNPIAVWFGLISYPLYLWHWPILSFLYIVEGGMAQREIRILAVVISVVLAWLTYFYLEKPVRGAKVTFKLSARLIIASVLVGLIGFYVYQSKGVPSRVDLFKNDNHIQLNEEIMAEFVGPIWEYANNEACLSKYGIEEAKDWGWFFCSMNKDRPPTIVLLGNSYANQLYAGFIDSEDLNHHTILSIGTCNVEWPNFKEKSREVIEGDSPCIGKRELIQFEHINKIVEAEDSLKYAVLVLSDEEGIDEQRYEALLRRIKFIRSNGIDVILFQSHIRPSFNINTCYGRSFLAPSNDCAIDLTRLSKHNKVADELVNKIKAEVDVYSFNPNVIFCEGESCSYILENGLPSFRDGAAHFSKFASERLIEKHFVAWAKQNVPNIFN